MLLLAIAIAIRVVIAVFTRTFFQPDEYFQSLEPAHHIVFGYGILTWEWMTPHPIRSIVYPSINIPVYWFLKVSGLVNRGSFGDWLLIVCPKIIHGLLAACTDIYAAEIARNSELGLEMVSTTLFLSLTSFFHVLALSRSLSNSLETSLTTISFAYYPWDPRSQLQIRRIKKMIFFSSLACVMRPTSAVVWVFLYVNLLWTARHQRRVVLNIFKQILKTSVASIGFMVTADSLYYGNLTFTPLNFLKTNFSSVSLFYGGNPWHYYITQAIPILCTTTLPFALHGFWITITSTERSLQTMMATIFWTTGIYSLAGHKEWRFLHPILPLLHIFAAKSLVHCFGTPLQRKRTTSFRENFKLPQIPKRYFALLLLTIPASLFVVFFYCHAPVTVLSYIRSIPRNELGNSTLGFLMPCHSTPGHAYLHRDELAHGGMWALGCEPPLEGQQLSNYKDQTDVFYDSPKDYLLTYFPGQVNRTFPPSPFPTSIPGVSVPLLSVSISKYSWNHEWPRHLIFFGHLLQAEGFQALLEQKGYTEVWRAGRDWEGEGKRSGGVRIWKFVN